MIESNDVSENKILLSVVIINYCTPSMTIDCLESLLPELDSKKSRIVLVDNNSTDDSQAILTDWIKKNDKNSIINFIKSKTNYGFSSGNNIGISSIDSDYYLLLNSDTLIRKNSIKKLLNTATKHSDVGIISPKLVWPDSKGQKSCFRFHHPVSEFIRSAQTRFIDRLFHQFIIALPVQNNMINTDWTSFACVLIKKEVFSDIGLMDDGYFMYFEDAEFCHRASNAGWQIAHNPEVAVVHLRGGSSPVKSNTLLKKRLPRYYYESRARHYYQLFGWLGLTLANLFWTAGRVISKSRQLLGRRDKAISDKQWLDIWCNWLNPLKKYTHPGSNKGK